MDGLLGSGSGDRDKRRKSASRRKGSKRKRSRSAKREPSDASSDGADKSFFSKLGRLKRALTRRRTDTTQA
eukprot:7254936-Alexandrium_andersonii.AAC.1